jgi:Ca2+-binding EF-hand superfamily protein
VASSAVARLGLLIGERLLRRHDRRLPAADFKSCLVSLSIDIPRADLEGVVAFFSASSIGGRTSGVNYRRFVDVCAEVTSPSATASKTSTATTTAASTSSKAASKPLSVSDRVATELRTKFDAAIDSGKIRSYEDVFRAMDKDGDGTVSKAEFEDGLRDLRVCGGMVSRRRSWMPPC